MIESDAVRVQLRAHRAVAQHWPALQSFNEVVAHTQSYGTLIAADLRRVVISAFISVHPRPIILSAALRGSSPRTPYPSLCPHLLRAGGWFPPDPCNHP